MEEEHSNSSSIISKVRGFCDEIIAGNVSDELLRRHKIPEEYLAVCRNQAHPSCKKLRKRLFEYIMDQIGYYDNLGNNEKLVEINASIDELLNNPTMQTDNKGLNVPRIILGVDSALDKIEKLNNSNHVDFSEKGFVSNVQFGKEERRFELAYNRDPRQFVSLEGFNLPQTTIQIDGEVFMVPSGGSSMSGHTVTFTQPDEVTIRFDRFHSSNILESKSYFFRYVTQVGDKDDVCREFEKYYFDIDGQDTFTIDTKVNGQQLTLYTHIFNNKRYLVIEYHKKLNAREIADFCFSVLVALGMITTTVHLNECWLVAYEKEDMVQMEGLFYQSMTDSIKCNYSIFTSNVYPALVTVAKQIDPINGEHRACAIIDQFKLSNALPWFSCEVFGRLVENMVSYEELRRGIFIILMGSRLHLEVQAAIYCVALEAISNLAPKIIGKKKVVIITRKKDWRTTLKRYRALTEELYKQRVITEEEKKDLDKKLESMNRAFNSEKLRALLEYYHYPLKQFDELTLVLRNLLLHGSISFDLIKNRKPEDYLFELSINLHKLCCATALLMSGYEGYILNNRKLYGFAKSYKAFIRIGNNVKIDYPKYKEKQKFWIRLREKMKNLCCN